MQKGGVEMYEYVRQSEFRYIQLPPLPLSTTQPSVLQNILRGLLESNPGANGCLPPDDDITRQRIAASFVNAITIECFRQSTNYFGSITDLSDSYLRGCMKQQIAYKVSNECPRNTNNFQRIR